MHPPILRQSLKVKDSPVFWKELYLVIYTGVSKKRFLISEKKAFDPIDKYQCSNCFVVRLFKKDYLTAAMMRST